MKQDDHYALLFKHISHWSWGHFLYQFDETHLFISDASFIKQLRLARKDTLLCKTAQPDNYRSVNFDSIKKVLVFCCKGELAIIKELQEKYPEIQVTSGTYGYACVGKDRRPRLKQYKPAISGKKSRPLIILSTPYADAEFIANVMEMNGLPYAHEFLARPFSTWMKLQDNFQIARFYNVVEDQYSVDGQLPFLLQTDALCSLFENTHFNVERFIAFLKKTDAKIITFSRNNKIEQAAIGQLLSRTAERSVWTKKANKKINGSFRNSDFIGFFEKQKQIDWGVNFFSYITQYSQNILNISLEDFVEDQSANIRVIAKFLEVEVPPSIAEINYETGYENFRDIYPAIVGIKRDLSDRLGLHSSLLG